MLHTDEFGGVFWVFLGEVVSVALIIPDKKSRTNDQKR